MHWTEVQVRVPEQPFLTTDEVVALVKVHKKTLARWVRDGRFPPPRRKGLWSGVSIGMWLAFQDHVKGPEAEDEDDDEEEKGAETGPSEKPVKRKNVES